MSFWDSITNLFGDSEEQKIEKELKGFESNLSTNAIALKVTDSFVTGLENQGLSSDRIENAVLKAMPQIRQIVRQYKSVLDLAHDSSDLIVKIDKDLESVNKGVSKSAKKDSGEKADPTTAQLAKMISDLEKKVVTREEAAAAETVKG